jgi:hypothetical protein
LDHRRDLYFRRAGWSRRRNILLTPGAKAKEEERAKQSVKGGSPSTSAKSPTVQSIFLSRAIAIDRAYAISPLLTI